MTNNRENKKGDDMKTKHNENCSRVFKNYDMKCPRCIELANGSAPRDGWQKDYFTRKAREKNQRLNAIRNHDCKLSNCGPVCTAFDW